MKRFKLSPYSFIQSHWTSAAAAFALFAGTLQASENVPRRPFAEWADIPAKDQLVFGILYQQSEAYYVWEGRDRNNITVHANNGESYGIDIRQGYFTLDYGLTERWALDINFGGTTVGWRSFDPNAGVQETTGIMDTTIGARYQIFNETNEKSIWIPTLTFRAAGILPGTYNQDIGFAPGNRSAAIEPSFLLRKHFGWEGLGAWGDLLYRWEHTIGTDQYMAAIGLFQKIKGWELDAGYRHFQTTSGSDLVLIPPATGTPPPWDGITYPRNLHEIREIFEAGFSYTTRRHVRWSFVASKTFDGENTDSKLWLGGYVDIPINDLFGCMKTKKPKD
jgi:hypothetical protein